MFHRADRQRVDATQIQAVVVLADALSENSSATLVSDVARAVQDSGRGVDARQARYGHGRLT